MFTLLSLDIPTGDVAARMSRSGDEDTAHPAQSQGVMSRLKRSCGLNLFLLCMINFILIVLVVCLCKCKSEFLKSFS